MFSKDTAGAKNFSWNLSPQKYPQISVLKKIHVGWPQAADSWVSLLCRDLLPCNSSTYMHGRGKRGGDPCIIYKFGINEQLVVQYLMSLMEGNTVSQNTEKPKWQMHKGFLSRFNCIIFLPKNSILEFTCIDQVKEKSAFLFQNGTALSQCGTSWLLFHDCVPGPWTWNAWNVPPLTPEMSHKNVMKVGARLNTQF